MFSVLVGGAFAPCPVLCYKFVNLVLVEIVLCVLFIIVGAKNHLSRK